MLTCAERPHAVYCCFITALLTFVLQQQLLDGGAERAEAPIDCCFADFTAALLTLQCCNSSFWMAVLSGRMLLYCCFTAALLILLCCNSNFWMAVLSGRKLWQFFDEQAMPVLYPSVRDEYADVC